MLRTSGDSLICIGVPIAREGVQEYAPAELGLDGSGSVIVHRPGAEVFDPTAMASFEGVPLTDGHPPSLLNPGTWSAYTRGHVQNVRPGPPDSDGNRTLIADLVVHDANLIDNIRNGKRQISCGYKCEYQPQTDGTLVQRAIRGNHVAVVDLGRAGSEVHIMDSKNSTEEEMNQEEIEKLADAVFEIVKKRLEARETAATDGLPRRIVREATQVENLMRRNASRAELHQAFVREIQDSQGDYGTDYEQGQEWAKRCQEVGRQMGESFLPRDCRPSLRRATTDSSRSDAEEDFATIVNRRGAELRRG